MLKQILTGMTIMIIANFLLWVLIISAGVYAVKHF